MFGIFRKLRRRRLAERPFPEDWLKILNERVPFFSRIHSDKRPRFLETLRIFAEEKTFTGVAGMEITDEVKVVISACAARLVLNLDLSYYDRLSEIIVYPYVYRHPNEDHEIILGEAADWGTVVLAWPAVLEGLSDPRDGHETALHEFAHVLDRENGVFNGTPKLKAKADYEPWAHVMSEHFLALRDEKRTELKVLDYYGATNEAEFFAVATESYFEKPRQMKKYMPDLYEELQSFYGGDPAADAGRKTTK